MRAGELCVREVFTADPSETVVEAARRMSDNGVGDLIIVGTNGSALPRPLGIITDRDLVKRVLARPERIPAKTYVADVMCRKLFLATESDDVEHVLATMRTHAIRRIPIVDERGGLQGILSIDDVLGWMSEQIQALTKLLDHQGRGPQALAPRFG